MTDRDARVIRVGRVLPAWDRKALGPSEIELGKDGRIAAVRPLGPDARLNPVEAACLAMPGLSDAHDHGRGMRTLACGIPDQSLETWLPDLGRQPVIDPWRNAAVALARIARSGVCVVNHCHNTQDGRALLQEAEAVSRAARDIGVTVAFGWPFFDANPYVYGGIERFADTLPAEVRPGVLASEARLRDCATNMALFEQAKAFEHAAFVLQYHPVAPQWTQPDTLRAIARSSAHDGRRVHMHFLETRAQKDWADTHFPGGLLGYLDDLGLLNDRLTLAHAVWLDDAEIARLARCGATVSVNASSNLRLRSGTAAIGAMLDAGVKVAFGLDGMALDDDEDMLRELRLAWHLAARPDNPGYGRDPRAVLRGVFETGRCSALGADGGGRIEPGAPADIVVLNYAAMTADFIDLPDDPAAALLGRAHAGFVHQVYARGRRIVDEGQCTGVDLDMLERELLDEARASRRARTPDEAAIGAMRRAVCAHYAPRDTD